MVITIHCSWVLIRLIVRERYDETRINEFFRLQDMVQRKRVFNDEKDCDGSDIMIVKKRNFWLARSLTPKKV